MTQDSIEITDPNDIELLRQTDSNCLFGGTVLPSGFYVPEPDLAGGKGYYPRVAGEKLFLVLEDFHPGHLEAIKR